ncbi:MAG: RdgB/HAM1 family non-canonical purine NTP pyrophosphatase [Pedobacter sp.]|nr:MAG: RdgB/HAM1 family non-canonical purine NTP pyrophosphatase [Pedobacter sp.]
MGKLIFATHNSYKANEVKALLSPDYEVLSLTDINCLEDIPETGTSFAENAHIKSKYVSDNFNLDCFADDSGLEVEFLNNEPGIFSARYSGNRGDEVNLLYLLKKMEGQTNRKARFKTVISLMLNGESVEFEGLINGTLRTEPTGGTGFGYDPIFQPDGFTETFAQMSLDQKNEISHRAIAMRKLIAYLKDKV